MTTTIIKTIGVGGATNGYDYADFNAAAAAIPSSIVDTIWRLRVDPTSGELSHTVQQAITGKTRDSTSKIIIEPNTGKGFNDNGAKLTTAYAYNATYAAAKSSLTFDVAFKFSSVDSIFGMQFKTTSSGSPCGMITAPNASITNCILDMGSTGYDAAGSMTSLIEAVIGANVLCILRINSGYNASIWGCRFNASGTHLSHVLFQNMGGQGNGNTYALTGSGGTLASMIGCGFFGLAGVSDPSGGVAISPSHCYTDLATLAGTSNLTSQTLSALVNATTGSDYRVKSGASIINASIADATYTLGVDGVGTTRSASTPTMGPWEYASGAATAVTLTGPSSGAVGAASTNFTAGANGTITGTVVVTPSDGGGGGTFTPTTVSISSGTPTATFTYTPASAGAKTISVTNNGSLSNPSSITYTASSAGTKSWANYYF